MNTGAAVEVRSVGIIGAGKAGVAIAGRALAAGYRVHIAASGPTERTALVTRIVLPGALAVTAEELPGVSDVIFVCVPLRKWRTLPADLWTGRIVVDVMNYWPPADGILPEFETSERSSSEIVRDGWPASVRLVKTLNHIGYHDIEECARPAGAPDRVALGIAGDDRAAVVTVAGIVDAFGFDPVDVGALAAGAVLQPGRDLFGALLGGAAFQAALQDGRQRENLAECSAA
ncbi:NADPH-dependent F420 reductase [Streptomyces sp. B21-083]|uniref:NADPH-dependent F420 reductase n=1 Tax=Streptomyces sp. B21-083 TaxID=3039410 RepID=UPI002FF4303F